MTIKNCKILIKKSKEPTKVSLLHTVKYLTKSKLVLVEDVHFGSRQKSDNIYVFKNRNHTINDIVKSIDSHFYNLKHDFIYIGFIQEFARKSNNKPYFLVLTSHSNIYLESYNDDKRSGPGILGKKREVIDALNTFDIDRYYDNLMLNFLKT